jgi:Arc/MetJ-type ribon-helix-helix transcriptional regulator
MDTISIRLDERMTRLIEKTMKTYHYSTITEFVRTAIRDKIKELEKEKILMNISKLAGSSKRKTTDKQLHELRDKVFETLEKKHNPKEVH